MDWSDFNTETTEYHRWLKFSRKKKVYACQFCRKEYATWAWACKHLEREHRHDIREEVRDEVKQELIERIGRMKAFLDSRPEKDAEQKRRELSDYIAQQYVVMDAVWGKKNNPLLKEPDLSGYRDKRGYELLHPFMSFFLDTSKGDAKRSKH